jgi:hypothetical protein
VKDNHKLLENKGQIKDQTDFKRELKDYFRNKTVSTHLNLTKMKFVNVFVQSNTDSLKSHMTPDLLEAFRNSRQKSRELPSDKMIKTLSK